MNARTLFKYLPMEKYDFADTEQLLADEKLLKRKYWVKMNKNDPIRLNIIFLPLYAVLSPFPASVAIFCDCARASIFG